MTIDELVESLSDSQMFDLEQPRRAGDPVWPSHAPGFLYWLHRRHEAGLGESRTSASGTVVMAEHSGTHIDALCHQAEDLHLHGGIAIDPGIQTSSGFTDLDASTLDPIIGRGVLVDVAGRRDVEPLDEGYAVTAPDLEDAIGRQEVDIRAGDIVLVRTGNGSRWEETEAYERGPGIGPDASRWLAEQRPAAVGCDNLAWDVPGLDDPELGTLPGHLLLIVRSGIFIIENLMLEELSARNIHEFLFVCSPLKMVGATGSPVRPLAFARPSDMSIG